MSYLYPPTVTTPLDEMDVYELDVVHGDRVMCDECGAYPRTAEVYRHVRDECPATNGAAGYQRATLYHDDPAPPAGVTEQYAREWANERQRHAAR
ncbi:hypothetical protein J1771_gp74 [Gordonia phage MelBins]|uniref:Uncharacterized protein n=1 Tax=Gordonia phage MelBins TaxID=2656540 RepID=A0A649VMP7_9CAUD|nr:hypothetical protein J1771_gp74 [Gordonia phage MelBins]QGJ93628.1 hypothetical protein SEA_MELBINS_74 [Gordonia phage MelBins]